MPAIYAAGKANVKNPPREFTDLAIRKGFHDAFVAQGGLPIAFVRRILFRAAETASR